tara:strand:- start:340 stop:879 length:540 start_codon:yes stop_codon:yes gene_type:complete
MQNQRKRGAIELSITTIVVVVIGLTILTLGLRWVYSIFGGFQKDVAQVQDFSQEQIQQIFGQSEDPIYSPTNVYQIKQGEKLSINMFIRNKIDPGGTYNFQYKINPLTFPATTNEEAVANSLTYYISEKELKSGAGFEDLVRFNSKELPIGDYRFETVLYCKTVGCERDNSLIFLIEVI